MMDNVATVPITLLWMKAPKRIRNSPTKTLSPGIPRLAMIMNIITVAKMGTRRAIPPRSEIS